MPAYWMNFVIPKILNDNKIDLFFSPNHLIPFHTKNNIKKVIVVHDVVHKVDKNYHSFIYNKYLDIALSKSILESNHIITISENSKQDIIKFYNVCPEKISVIYRTAEKDFQPRILNDTLKNELMRKYELPENFILYVGMVENRKNILGMLKIADALQEKNSEIKMVIIGRPGHGFDELYKEILKRDRYIKYLNYVEDESLKYIYNLAYVFLFPSFYEGFGLPPLEAMQSGIPVLCSNTSSLPEVIDDGGFLFAPEDYSSYVDCILRLFQDKAFYNEAKQKALLQAKKFNKETTTKQLVEVFNNIKY
jgi:glycosyltransferase involved in cell wall biosynthesis